MKHLFTILLIAAFLNGLLWVLVIPVWQYPDEQAHFSQVQDVAELGGVPKIGNTTSSEIALSEKVLETERNIDGNNKFTYHPEKKLRNAIGSNGLGEAAIKNLDQNTRLKLVKKEATENPPLYYFLASLVYTLFYPSNLFTRVFAIRLLSLFLFAFTLFVTYKIAKLIFGKKNLLPLFFISLVSFMPMLVFSSTGILPDPLTNLLFSAVIYLSLKVISSGLTFKRLTILLMVAFLGILTRQHFIIAVPISSAAVLHQLLKTKKYFLIFLSMIIIPCTLTLVQIAGTTIPIINNFRIPDISNLNFKYTSNLGVFDHINWTLQHTYAEVLPWYWGIYKWLSLSLPHQVYSIINRVLLLAVVGIFIYIIRIIKKRKINPYDLSIFYLIFTSVTYFSSLLVWDYFFRAKNNFSFGIQGRYYFPIVQAEIVILFVGLIEIFKIILKRNYYFALFALTVVMLFFNDYSLSYVAASYYNSANLIDFINHLSSYKPDFLKGTVLYLVFAAAIISQAIFIFYLGKATLNNKDESN